MNKNELLSRISQTDTISPYPKGSSAVIIPLLEKDGEMHILFEERAHTLEFQPGDVCFPGGRIEKGETPIEAAKREFFEELYSVTSYSEEAAESSLNILTALTPLMGPTGAPVYPFAALVKNDQFSYSKDEVERIFTYPVSYLKEHPPVSYPMQKKTTPPDNFPYEKVTGGKTTYNWYVQRYDMWVYKDTSPVIWGFTGRLLHSFLELI